MKNFLIECIMVQERLANELKNSYIVNTYK